MQQLISELYAGKPLEMHARAPRGLNIKRMFDFFVLLTPGGSRSPSMEGIRP